MTVSDKPTGAPEPATNTPFRDAVWTVIDRWLGRVSGEFLLKHRPNSGTVVLVRAFWVTAIIGISSLAIQERLAPSATWHPSLPHRDTLREVLPWLGAVFGATYAGLYTRFSAQWSYLAGLYNQLMAAAAQGPANTNAEREKVLAVWRAGFIEDAEDLHLATRPMYAGVILTLVDYTGVRQAYAVSTAGGEARLKLLEERCRRALIQEGARQDLLIRQRAASGYSGP